MSSMRWWLVLLLSCLAPVAGAAQASPPAEVAVLATLHRMHAEVPGYSNEVLARSIRRLAPDLLCIEVRPDRYAQRAAEANKVEYPQVVYPLLEADGLAACPLEPAPPRFDEILAPYLAAGRAFAEARPQASRAFAAHTEAMYASLRQYWTTAARVNDAVTDAQMRAKHALQDALAGEGERQGWEAWNRHFLEVVLRAAREHPGRRIVVLVGAEHAYWLRERLPAHPGIRLLDTAALLAADAEPPGGMHGD